MTSTEQLWSLLPGDTAGLGERQGAHKWLLRNASLVGTTYPQAQPQSWHLAPPCSSAMQRRSPAPELAALLCFAFSAVTQQSSQQ